MKTTITNECGRCRVFDHFLFSRFSIGIVFCIQRQSTVKTTARSLAIKSPSFDLPRYGPKSWQWKWTLVSSVVQSLRQQLSIRLWHGSYISVSHITLERRTMSRTPLVERQAWPEVVAAWMKPATPICSPLAPGSQLSIQSNALI